MKSTKKPLLLSTLSLILCVTMLLGATFAWFTDSVTSGKNKIVAGNLKVDLVMDKEANGQYVSIANEEAAIFGNENSLIAQNKSMDTLWEPGKTQIVYLGVKNGGNLALKYNIMLKVIDGGLASALEYAVIDGAKATDFTSVQNWVTIKESELAQTGNVTAGVKTAAQGGVLDEIAYDKSKIGETDYFALAVHMKEDAGNEYKDQSITIDVIVVAGQVAAEEDSFNNLYDAEALYEQIPESGSDGPLVFDDDDNTIVTGLKESFTGDTIILTEGVTEIGPGAFEGHSEINFISLPSTLTKIGEGAFSGIGDFTAEINGDQLEMKNVIDLDWTDKSKVNLIFTGKVASYPHPVQGGNGLFYPEHPYSTAGANGRELTLTFKNDVTFNAQDFVMSNINKISFTGENQVIKFSDLNFNVQGEEIHNNAPVFNTCSGNRIIEFHSLPAAGSIIRTTMTGGDSGFKFRAACSQSEWENAGFPKNIGGVNVEFDYNFGD